MRVPTRAARLIGTVGYARSFPSTGVLRALPWSSKRVCVGPLAIISNFHRYYAVDTSESSKEEFSEAAEAENERGGDEAHEEDFQPSNEIDDRWEPYRRNRISPRRRSQAVRAVHAELNRMERGHSRVAHKTRLDGRLNSRRGLGSRGTPDFVQPFIERSRRTREEKKQVERERHEEVRRGKKRNENQPVVITINAQPGHSVSVHATVTPYSYTTSRADTPPENEPERPRWRASSHDEDVHVASEDGSVAPSAPEASVSPSVSSEEKVRPPVENLGTRDEASEANERGEEEQVRGEPGVCSLCDRKSYQMTKHHLVPKSEIENAIIKRGRKKNETIPVCRPCHEMVHSKLTNLQMARGINTQRALRRSRSLEAWFEQRRKQGLSSDMEVDVESKDEPKRPSKQDAKKDAKKDAVRRILLTIRAAQLDPLSGWRGSHALQATCSLVRAIMLYERASVRLTKSGTSEMPPPPHWVDEGYIKKQIQTESELKLWFEQIVSTEKKNQKSDVNPRPVKDPKQIKVSKLAKDLKEVEDLEKIEDPKDVEDSKEVENSKKIEDSQEAEDSKDVGYQIPVQETDTTHLPSQPKYP
ncbi:Uncharacterized protein CGCA056_v013546 [Colletotrichum aenigma]|uniref:Uncharacterized protein n=1 Tax=Colletotrichum aenigma TaxID=1215731 RepID=UPI001873371F|nr:Uncharacterized protein CGCA056_v013546 [Colletotrichum aenigma]KAF5507683.1 Uncharacterized protein CGCA056_v013546 [Colletotrichum aenigma]